jgi:hypothetical protein
MRSLIWVIQVACILGIAGLSGCASTLLFPPAPVSLSTPFLLVDEADVQLIVTLTQEQDTRVENCQTRRSCPQDHYLQGLLALFRSRERALEAFQQVTSEAPHSRVAVWSSSWMDMLQTRGEASKVTEGFVWEVLARELNEADETIRRLFTERDQRVGGLTDRQPAINPDQASIPKDKATTLALHRRLHERERIIAERDQQIAVLSSQLDALKRIDQDTRDGRRPMRPSILGARVDQGAHDTHTRHR